MPENQKKVTLASNNYLQEVSAIPPRVRREFLFIVKNRKNDPSRMNLKLLRVIYSYVDENRIGSWNPKTVCKQAGISMNALYIHKSRLLQELKEYYFGWRKLEKEIEEKLSSGKNSSKSSIEMNLEKARKMAEIGMWHEAKKMFVKLEGEVRKAFINPSEKYVILTEIYEQIILYYFSRRNKYRLIHYVDKLDNASNSAKCLNLSLTKMQEALINIRIYYSKFYLYLMKWYGNYQAKMKINYPQKIYDISKKFSSFYLLKVLHHKAILAITSNKFDKAAQLCIDGYKIAKILKKEIELHTFASILNYLKTKTIVKFLKPDSNDIIKYYHRVKKDAPLNLWTVYLENSLVMTYYPEKRKEIFEVFREQINSSILLGDYSFAVYWTFVLDSEIYKDRLLTFFDYDSVGVKGYLELDKVDAGLLKDIENTCINTHSYHKELKNDSGFLWYVDNLHLMAYYFCEDDFGSFNCKVILNRMERIKNSKKITGDLSTFELLKLSLRILENSYSKKYMLSKYEHKLKRMIDGFKKDTSEFGIIDYAILSSLARRLKCREIIAIVRDLYGWTEKYHPEILRPVLRKIEERVSKVHTITGNEEAAA